MEQCQRFCLSYLLFSIDCKKKKESCNPISDNIVYGVFQYPIRFCIPEL